MNAYVTTRRAATRRLSASLLSLCFSFLLTGSLFAQDVTFGPGLQAALDAAGPADELEVIVTFEGDGPLTAAQIDALAATGVRGATLTSLPMAGVVATPAQVSAIAAMDGMRSLWPNVEMQYENAGGTALTGVDDARTDAQFQKMNGGLPVSGRGVAVVINDSGVDGTHLDHEYPSHLVQNVSGHGSLRDFTTLAPYVAVENLPHTDVGGGHGTHVAGIVGGTGARSGGRYEGVAPGADLIGYGSGVAVALIDVLSGFDYALTHQFEYGIRVVTNSWGNTADAGTDFNPDDPTNVATKKCTDRGMIIVFSAGNSGPNDDTISGNYKKAPWVITVAAGDKQGNLGSFSSRGKAGNGGTVEVDGETFTWVDEPTVTAPGVHIISTRATGGAVNGAAFDPEGELLVPAGDLPFYTSFNGTSMAAPHVAGIVALMLEVDPFLDAYAVKEILQQTATTMTGRAPHEVGAGYVNAYAAVAAAFKLDPTSYLHEPFGEDDNNGGGPGEGGTVLTDDEGDALLAGADITEVTVVEEVADNFVVTLHVADLEQATPSTMTAAGLQVGAMQEYEVEFDLEKAGEPTVRYTLSAKRTLVDVGVGTVALDAASFDYGVRAANGSGRGIGDLVGDWDYDTRTITWYVPRAVLDVAAPPADLTATIDHSGRAAQDGDVLKNFGAAVATSFWGGVVGITPGQTTYDEGSGTTRYTLGQSDDETDPDPDPEPNPEPDMKLLSPILECVVTHGDGSKTARFGYDNGNDFPVTLALGKENRFAPKPEDRGQPTTFQPGRHAFVFDVDFDKGNLVWKLGKHNAVAKKKKAPACEEPTPQPRVVVSVIDSGINPYHAFFNAGGEIYPDGAPSSVTPEVLDAFGIDAAHTLTLTRTGDFNADFAADAALWAGVQPGEVYWFEGTNVLAVSFDGGSRIILPDDEEDTHGVGTSAAALRANPEAILLFVEGTTEEAETFAFSHPEVDIVSTSYGWPGSLPLPGHIANSYTGVVEGGKLHFGAADNSPATSPQDGTSGPWWSIGVAGFEEHTSEGRQVISGTFPDFLGDFTQTLPYCANCEDGQRSVGGTSFATPRSAGTASKVLLEARRALVHEGGIQTVDGVPVMASGDGQTITNWQLRRALEESAYYPTIVEYDPIDGAFDIAAPIVDPAPWSQAGWGVLTTDAEHEVVPQTLAHLGFGEATRTKSDEACLFMVTQIEARHLYWDNVALGSESTGTTEDPYLYCNEEGGAAQAFAQMAPKAADGFGEVPGTFALDQNYPNPFNPSTSIRFSVAEAGPVQLAVYDLLGRQVRLLVDEASLSAGAHTVRFDARNLASGTYLYRLQAAGQVVTRQMTLLK